MVMVDLPELIYWIKKYGGAGAAKDGKIPYRIVAASDASAESKNMADYVCDGTSDQEEIQNAIDDLPSQGGIIFLTEGTYNFSDPGAGSCLSVGKNITLIGAGKGSTKIVMNVSGSGRGLLGLSAAVKVLLANMRIDFATSSSYARSSYLMRTGASVDGTEITVDKCTLYYVNDVYSTKNLPNSKIYYIDSELYRSGAAFVYMAYTTYRFGEIHYDNCYLRIDYSSGGTYSYLNNLYIRNSKIYINVDATITYPATAHVYNCRIEGRHAYSQMFGDCYLNVYNSYLKCRALYNSRNVRFYNCIFDSSVQQYTWSLLGTGIFYNCENMPKFYSGVIYLYNCKNVIIDNIGAAYLYNCYNVTINCDISKIKVVV